MKSRLLQKTLIFVFCLIFLSGCTNILHKEQKAGLQIITSDTPTSVFINGQYLDKTPLIKKDIKPGEYYVELKPDDTDLAQYETSVNLKAGLLTVITWKPGTTPEQSGGVIYEMEPLTDKTQTQIEFLSIPDGAIIEVPGKGKSLTPMTLDNVPAGELEYKAILPSYEGQENTINVVAGYKMLVTLKLAKQPSGEPATKKTVANSSTPSPTIVTTDEGSTESAQPSSNKEENDRVLIKPTNLFINSQEVLKVRAEPNVTSLQIGVAQVGKSYAVVIAPKDGWLKIKLGDDLEGWISNAYAELQ